MNSFIIYLILLKYHIIKIFYKFILKIHNLIIDWIIYRNLIKNVNLLKEREIKYSNNKAIEYLNIINIYIYIYFFFHFIK